MQVDYQPFVDRMIKRYEGGYCWDKGDPGGPTNFGITCYDLAEHRSQRMNSMAAWADPVKEMTLTEAEAIYATKYASGIRFNDLPAGPDCVMLDYGVNSGLARPILVARALVGLKGSGMNDDLINAIHKVDPTDFVDKMCAERLRFMHAIKGGQMWAEFGHGWGSRVADLQSYGDHLAASKPHVAAPEAPDLSKVVTPKATNTPKTAGTPTIGGVVTAGTAMKASGHGWLPTALVVGGIVAVGIAYEIYEEQKAASANAVVHI
jgi:lysozyme family protein